MQWNLEAQEKQATTGSWTGKEPSLKREETRKHPSFLIKASDDICIHTLARRMGGVILCLQSESRKHTLPTYFEFKANGCVYVLQPSPAVNNTILLFLPLDIFTRENILSSSFSKVFKIKILKFNINFWIQYKFRGLSRNFWNIQKYRGLNMIL